MGIIKSNKRVPQLINEIKVGPKILVKRSPKKSSNQFSAARFLTDKRQFLLHRSNFVVDAEMKHVKHQ